MATDHSTTTARTPTDSAAVHGLLRAGVLLAAYGGTLLVVAAASVAAVLYTNATFALPLAAQLALWLGGVAGVVAAPAAGRRVVVTLDARMDAGEKAPEPGRVLPVDDAAARISRRP